jgi:DNA topoisomerase-3
VDREHEIKNFIPKDFWTVQLNTGSFTATWRDAKGQSMIFDQDKANAIVAAISGGEGVLTSVTREFKYVTPPAAYDLTELQRDANSEADAVVYAESVRDPQSADIPAHRLALYYRRCGGNAR